MNLWARNNCSHLRKSAVVITENYLMRFLTPEHWVPFQQTDGRFDGVKFEKLVATLLPELYPGEWTPTKYSWDGKKDFYQQRGAERRWAECKAYRDPISINVVSPTLIMALLDDARVILLFSYSRLNKNARLYLGQFASLTSRKIRIFDDEVLEDLILVHADLNTFFPKVARDRLPSLQAITAYARISQDPDIEYQTENVFDADSQDIYLNLLSTFCVDVLVENKSIHSSPVAGVIRLDRNDLTDRFWLFNQDIAEVQASVPFTLQSGESFFKRLYFRARQTGKLAPPTIEVNVNGQDTQVLSLDPLEVSSILAVPLTGKPQNDALASFQHRVSAIDKPVFCQIYGRSGTGKSRLLREFRDVLLGRGFVTFTFNAENERNSSFDHFVKRLTSTVSKLPMLDHVVRPTAADTGFAAEGSGEALLDLLYCDTSRPSSNPAKTIKTILTLLISRKVAVVIDNMQFLDASTIDLINTAITETGGMPARNVWVLCLNTEVVTAEMPAANLSARLSSLAAEYPDAAQSVKLEGLSNEDARLYLDQALAADASENAERFSVTFPQTTSLILERVGTHPLFLEQALQLAADRGGLGLRSGRLRVIDIGAFHAAIEDLPSRIRQLIAKRWEFVGEKLSDGAVLLVKALAEFITMPMQLAYTLGVQRDDILTLTSLGLVDISESNEVAFHHRQHYLFFADIYGEAPATLAQMLLEAIETSGRSEQYPFQRVALREGLGQLTDSDLLSIAAVVIDKTNTGPARRRATPLLLEVFNRPDLAVDPRVELQVVNTLCQEVKRHVAFNSAAIAFEKAYSLRRSRQRRYLPYGDDYHRFVHDYANSFFALHRDGEALPLLESSLREFENFQFQSEGTKLLSKGKLLNRLCVALKTIHDLPAAEQIAQESLAIAESLGDTRLTYKNYIDWGYLHHGFYRSNDELARLWGKALEVFQQNASFDPSIAHERASYLLHSAELKILDRDRTGAIETIEEGIRYSRRTLTPFHEVKLLLLRVVADLAWGTEVNPRILTPWLDKAEDRAVTTRAQRSFWIVFYARAKLDWILKNHEKSSRNFLLALEQIAKILTDPRMEERHEPFFEDLAIHLRMAGHQMSEREMQLIRNSRIRELVRHIVEAAPPSFDDMLNSYTPTATFHDGRYNLPVP
jgi:tetratricopeptide (TPR) repeat protein